jgi:Tfp pilus assembly protein PilF
VAASLNNLGTFYYAQGLYEQAESSCKRAVAIWEKALGPDHPNVAAGLENLAAVYRKMDRAEDAEALEQRAARIREKNQ